MKDKSSCKLTITPSVPGLSVLGPLLFLLYINDLRKAIQQSRAQFTTSLITDFLCTCNSLKKVNKHINHDLKHLCQWLRSNIISLTSSKTEILFKLKLKPITKHINFRVNGKKINITTSVKYLGLQLKNSLMCDIH